METKELITIGMREFMRTTKDIKAKVAKGYSFEVYDHLTPVFQVIPVPTKKTKRVYQFADLTELQFTGPKDLAHKVDRTAYDI
jgi:antitoxin (DNA-binding transcriptional repressor) of toxin-antitoxin stability system